MFRKQHRPAGSDAQYSSEPKPGSAGGDETVTPPHQSMDKDRLPTHNQDGGHTKHHRHHVSRLPHGGVAAAGESGRRGIHPLLFLRICFRSTSRMSMMVNFLWPVVPAAIAVHFAIPQYHVVIFTLNYIAMVPAANLIGFAGQELARKLPKVLGVLLETTLGSIVELVLFMVLLVRGRDVARDAGEPQSNENIPVIRAAILGSILANLLLCLGCCFIAGGFQRDEQMFHEAISEVGSGLLLVAGMGLVIPAAFSSVLIETVNDGIITQGEVSSKVLDLSRATAVILLFAYLVYVYFQMSSHHGLYDEVLEADEQRDADRHKDLAKQKLTFTECILALAIALTCVSLIAVFLVFEIEHIVAHGVSDAFMGLILVPLVEKAAEHLTAIDEAYDNQANFALAHVLGACIQTALLNTPLVVIVGWCLSQNMDLDFKQFEAIILILAILVVGNFLKDGKSNYLEGSLCVLVYIIVAVSAWYYPDHDSASDTQGGGGGVEGEGASEPLVQAAKLLMRATVG